MYEEYFGLERPPFKITPDTSLFYEGGKRGDILGALVYAIHRGEGIVKVVGEVGSGKTMLCRMLQLKLPDTVEIIYIANPSVSAEDILFVIAHELSLPVAKEASKHEVMHMLQDYLLQRHMENKQVVLFVEEAQGMPLDTLEEIRLLSNLETDENKLLQIVLFGQPELDENLAEQSIRQLRERITHNFELEPLTREEIHNYLNFRMRQVGYTGPELINDAVAKKVELHSEGLLRRINIIADKILLSAFAEGTHNLSSKHVTAAVNDSSFNQEVKRKTSPSWWPGLLLVTLAFAAFALYQTQAYWIPYVPTGASFEQEMPANATRQQALAVTAEPDESNLPLAAEESKIEAQAEAEPGVETEVPAPVVESVEEQSAGVGELEPIESAVEPDAMDSEGETIASETQLSSEEMSQEPESTTPEEQEDIVTAQLQDGGQVVEASTPSVEAQESQDVSTKEVLEPVNDGQEASVALSESASSMNGNDLVWLDVKLAKSRVWLANADDDKLSIQVMMRKKPAIRELVYYLLNEWPLALTDTYLYEVGVEGRTIYRVFYSEYNTVNEARAQIDKLPDDVKANSPYVHSVYLMRRDLL